jgi:hypothetical protein
MRTKKMGSCPLLVVSSTIRRKSSNIDEFMEVDCFAYRVYELSSSGTVLCNEGQKRIHPLTIGQKEITLS